MRTVNIAIDGYAGCGKSTLAHDLASALGYVFVDTGAMYRAITFLALSESESDHISKSIVQQVIHATPEITFAPGSNAVLINGEDAEVEIRSPKVAAHVSQVAAMPMVRDYLKSKQQEWMDRKGIVMEGRDIGTVIMPQAEVKLFITASMESRVNRRLIQLQESGEETTAQAVRENLVSRDRVDATRKAAPLAKAQDAIALDTSEFSREQQLSVALSLIRPFIDPEGLLPFLSV